MSRSLDVLISRNPVFRISRDPGFRISRPLSLRDVPGTNPITKCSWDWFREHMPVGLAPYPFAHETGPRSMCAWDPDRTIGISDTRNLGRSESPKLRSSESRNFRNSEARKQTLSNSEPRTLRNFRKPDPPHLLKPRHWVVRIPGNT